MTKVEELQEQLETAIAIAIETGKYMDRLVVRGITAALISAARQEGAEQERARQPLYTIQPLPEPKPNYPTITTNNTNTFDPATTTYERLAPKETP